MTIITAAPFALIMILMCIALAKELRNDPLVHRDDRTAAKVARAVEYGTTRHSRPSRRPGLSPRSAARRRWPSGSR